MSSSQKEDQLTVYKNYLHHRGCPTPRQWAHPHLSETHREHLTHCPRCQKIYDYVISHIEQKHATDYCRTNGSDFNSVHVGDIRTLSFDYLMDSEKGKFLNSPEVCVMTVPPKLSYSASIVVAQACPLKYEKLADGDVVSGDYLLEKWNIYSVPMIALIDFSETLFPTVCLQSIVPRDVIRTLHSYRNKKIPASTNSLVEKFRTQEKAIAQKIKQYLLLKYKEDI